MRSSTQLPLIMGTLKAATTGLSDRVETSAASWGTHYRGTGKTAWSRALLADSSRFRELVPRRRPRLHHAGQVEFGVTLAPLPAPAGRSLSQEAEGLEGGA